MSGTSFIQEMKKEKKANKNFNNSKYCEGGEEKKRVMKQIYRNSGI